MASPRSTKPQGEFIGIERMGEGKFHVEVKDIDLTGEDLHTYF